eukprot:GGOE01054850.1.p1 GENE.GGOE01054850.1~~GGOE01054850.1.p1  ORF type:complete len:1018 (+),score=268.98 GGOE01054850.1:81-3134(+)
MYPGQVASVCANALPQPPTPAEFLAGLEAAAAPRPTSAAHTLLFGDTFVTSCPIGGLAKNKMVARALPIYFFSVRATMSKWFRNQDADSDEDEESEEESASESESSESDSNESGSGESDENNESDESGEEMAESAPRANRFLKQQGKESDSDDDRVGGNVVSKDKKRHAELEKIYNALKDHMKVSDVKSAQEDMEKMVKKYGSDAEIPSLFFKAIVYTDRWLKDKEAKEKAQPESKTKDKDKVKALGLLKQRVKKITGREDLFPRLKAAEKALIKEEQGDDDDEDEEEEAEKEDEDLVQPAREKARAEEEDKEWKPELIEKKLQEVLALRGKRGTDKMEQIESLKRILLHTGSALLTVRLQLMVHLVAAWYDNTPQLATHMPAASWRAAYDNLIRILNLLNDHPEFIIRESEDDLNEQLKFEKMQDSNIVTIEGNFMGFTERLDDEFIKALQFTDPHTQGYVERLADEPYMMDILERVFHYYKTRELHKHAARIAAKILDHLYYRRQGDHVKMLAKQRIQTDQRRRKLKKQDDEEEKRTLAAAEAAAQAEAEGGEGEQEDYEETADGRRVVKIAQQPWWVVTGSLSDSMNKCMTAILKFGDEKAKARALMCKVYHLALHDQYTQARDIILMSHIHEIVASASPTFQILFNRALAQMGMAAFRLGQFKDVHVCLNELCATQRVKELLAQGIPNPKYQQDRKPEEERMNKMKLCPFHMHINLDVLEAVSLVSALLLEVPMMAANPYDSKRKVQSKAFNKLLNHYESQVFLGPPENTRDHIYAASRALLNGDWKECYRLIAGLSVWDLVPQGDAIKKLLHNRVKEEGLRAYLLQYGQCYETVSLKLMADKFELDETLVHSIISKMMFNEELSGSWDQPAGCVRMHRTNPTKLQHLCLLLADKASNLVENNEKILDSRGGGFGAAYKMGQDAKPMRPQETLWGNFNRWSNIGGPSSSGPMRRQQTGGQRSNNQSSAFGQMGRMGNRQTQNRGFNYGGGGNYSGGFGSSSAFSGIQNRNRFL